MCRKDPKDCKAKVKCKIYDKAIDNPEICDNINLNEVDILLEQQTYIIDIKGE